MNRHPYGRAFGLALLLVLLAPGRLSSAASASQPRSFLDAPLQPQEVIPACDPITTTTTWTAENIYVVQNCNLAIAAGATLTIEPGVIVKFWGAGSAAVIVDGTLNATGTAEDPIIFTSYADDAHGDDTNSNGDSSGTAGDWYGLVFRAGSTGHLEHFFVGYAGSGALNAVGWGRAQIDVRAAAVILRHGTITDGLRKGVYLEGAGLTPVIENVHVANNNDPASDKPGYAIYQDSINMQPTYSAITFSGNDRDEVTIGIGQPMTQSVTLGGANFGVVCGFSVCQLSVPEAMTLTVQPGTLLDFGASYGLAVAGGGSLIAEGTSSRPITFTSQLAANGDASQNWLGVWAQSGSTLRLDHCDISYSYDSNYGKGGLEINTSDALISNCRIHHNKHTGLYLYNRDGAGIHPTLTNVDVTDNGQHGVMAYSVSTLSVTWDGGSISRNGWSGVAAYNWNSIVEPTLRNLAIADNGLLGASADQRAGIYWIWRNANPILENLSITGNVGAAVLWYCDGSITARNLTAAGNGANELELPGCSLNGGRRWDLGGAGIPVRVNANIMVEPYGLLTILPGTTLQFDRLDRHALYVKDQAALYALGTADEPVIFTGATAEPGWWAGIEVVSRATVALRHCEIAYGGGSVYFSASLDILGTSSGVPAVNIQNCEIHHSGTRGVHFDFRSNQVSSPPVFRYNNLHDNTNEAVTNWNAPPLDARDNWWGHASGPSHPTTNPGGQGDSVGNNIVFYPWLGAPSTGGEVPGEMLVSTGAPNQISPGETVDYAVQYLNLMTETVHSGVLMLQLPQAGAFIDGTHGAIYWPERHQVIWKLGDLLPGANGFVSARVRFQWGLAADYRDGSYTQFAGEDYNAGALDVAEYNAYESTVLTVTDITPLSPSEFDTIRGSSAALESLYQLALTDGFQTMSAARITYHDGTVVVNAALRTSDRQYGRILSLNDDGQVLASTVGGGQVAVRDMTGGLTASLNTQTYEFWGSWQPGTTSLAAAGCGENRCFANCMIKAKSWGAVSRKAAGAVSWVFPPLGAVWTAYEAYDEITTYLECKEDCRLDPDTHCCTSGEIRWSPTGLKQQCAQYSCDAVGTWKQTPDIIQKCDLGQRCVDGKGSTGGCKDCEEDLLAATFTPVSVRTVDTACGIAADPRCSELTVRRAGDPNAIYGPVGDVLPGDVVTYTITYENEGAGLAYGVYVVNPLPEVFDEGTLNFVHGAGTYLPESREIVWLVGELKPKGAVGSAGIITYTVSLTGSLPSGTVVSNQAMVFFQSVPEETPTNTWVNLVLPLAATPQNLTTNYMTPLDITLSGRDVSGLPLTYEIVEEPHGGTLIGTAPNLTYTPSANHTGADGFTFQVNNGTSTSRAAQVYITVTSAGDTTPPEVLWTNPAADATDVSASVTPVLTDTDGPVYSPVILIGVSEALSETTVTSATVTLAKGDGTPLAYSVAFDAAVNQIVLTPRVALAAGETTVTVLPAIADRAGNTLQSAYAAHFTVAVPGPSTRYVYLPLALRRR